MDPNHPALVAARNSWRSVMDKDKAGWLALMAEDVCVEDPIGVAPTNPSGAGIRGKAALAEFYDKNMAPAEIVIEAEKSFAAGKESAHVLHLTTAFPNGVKMHVHGIFTYRIDDAGRIESLRGFWSLEDSSVEQPDS
jgi:steroid delta-isomerase